MNTMPARLDVLIILLACMCQSPSSRASVVIHIVQGDDKQIHVAAVVYK